MDKKSKEMLIVLRKVGLDEDACARTMRLLSAAPAPEEKRRWQQIGLMECDRIIVTDEEMGDLGITVCLWDLMWRGMLVRVTDPLEIAAQLKFEEESKHGKRPVNLLAPFSPNPE